LLPQLKEDRNSCPERHEFYLAGIFGTVHPEWDPEVAVSAMLPLVQRCHKKLVLVFLGRSGLTPADFERLKARLKSRAEVLTAGEKLAADISKILQALDLGLATTPLQIIQKSGSVAAMREHGLPVLVIRDDCYLAKTVDTSMIETGSIYTKNCFYTLEMLPERASQMEASSARLVATRMLNSLGKPSNENPSR